MRLLIIGCGYVGTALAKRLLDGGHRVRGVTASAESAAALARDGLPSCAADCSTREGARAACREPADAVVFSVSSRGGDYRKTYVEGMRCVLAALEAHPPTVFIYTGSTSVYAQMDGGWVGEDSPTEPPYENGKRLLETERLLRRAAGKILPSVWILRLAAIYGPDRHVLLDRLRTGIETLPGDGRHWMNQVHRDDIVSVIELVMTRSQRGFRILNVADDTPVCQQEYVEWGCAKLRRPIPGFLPEAKSRRGFQANRRISNRTIRELGWAPKYPSFREGLAERLGGDRGR